MVEERTAELQATNDRLRAEIAERAQVQEALRLSQERLRHSEKMEAIGQLSAGIAHDFNNILTIIQVHATLQMEEQQLPAETEQAMHEISTAAERAATLVNQLLAFSRKQSIRAREVDLCRLLAGMETMLARVLSAAIDLRFEVPASLPPVWVDPTSVEHIVLTLAVNARDAMEQGGRLPFPRRRLRSPVNLPRAHAMRVRDVLFGSK